MSIPIPVIILALVSIITLLWRLRLVELDNDKKQEQLHQIMREYMKLIDFIAEEQKSKKQK